MLMDSHSVIRTFLLKHNLKEDEKIMFIRGIPHIGKKSKWELRWDRFLKLFRHHQKEYCDKCMRHTKQLRHCYDCNRSLCSKCWGVELDVRGKEYVRNECCKCHEIKKLESLCWS